MDPKVRKNNMMKVLKAKFSTPNYRIPVERLQKVVSDLGTVKAGQEFIKWSKGMPNSWQKESFEKAGKDLEKNLPLSKAFSHLIKGEIKNTNLGEKISNLPEVTQKGNNLAILLSNDPANYDSLKRQADGRRQLYEMDADEGQDYGGNTHKFDTIPSFLIPGKTPFTPEFEEEFNQFTSDLSQAGQAQVSAIKSRVKEILDAEPNTHITQAILQAENEIVSGGNPKDKLSKLRDVALDEARNHERQMDQNNVQALRHGGPLYLNSGGSWWDEFKRKHILGSRYQQPEAFPTPRPENLVPYQDAIMRDIGRTNNVPEVPPVPEMRPVGLGIPHGVQGLGAEGITGVGPSADMGLEGTTTPWGQVSATPNTGDWGSTYSNDFASGNAGNPTFNNQVGNLPSSQFSYSSDVATGNAGDPTFNNQVRNLPSSQFTYSNDAVGGDLSVPPVNNNPVPLPSSIGGPAGPSYMDDTLDPNAQAENFIMSNLDELSLEELRQQLGNRNFSPKVLRAIADEYRERKNTGNSTIISNAEEKKKQLKKMAEIAASNGDKDAQNFLENMENDPFGDSSELYAEDKAYDDKITAEDDVSGNPLSQLNVKTTNNKSKVKINKEISKDKPGVKTSGSGSNSATTGNALVNNVINETTTKASTADELMNRLSEKIEGLRSERDDEWNKSIMYGIAAYGLARLTGANFNQAVKLSELTMNATGNKSKMIQKTIDRYEQVHGNLDLARLKSALGVSSGSNEAFSGDYRGDDGNIYSKLKDGTYVDTLGNPKKPGVKISAPISPQNIDLPTVLLKKVNDTVAEAGKVTSQLRTLERLEKEITKDEGYPGIKGKIAELWKNFFGTQTDVSRWKTELTGFINKKVVNDLPPGIASDKDISLVLSGFPNSNWNPEQIKRWMITTRKILRYQEAEKEALGKYIENNRSQAGFRSWWKEQDLYKKLVPGKKKAEKDTNASVHVDLDLS